ncbi:MAG: NADH-quinone oxidoreductase subunit J [Euryarchaeota archaeon]|nr:NADH-quinone oxidoreductase subunit J [Euryarchaeota archaeon]MDE1835211.1 NADH-quinone oxidoreductase subunit J [Euryarchaeota archaeon]MDE1880068.1 NADH-quinone oxidoreductase subunit J [Euryarchaeota archaeon]MDE2043507.1 NADH-quinone oxidoreductase subunit J [Thermoplasmata archaeon]
MTLDPATVAFVLVGVAAFASGAIALLSREIVHTVIFIGGFFAGLAVVYFLLSAPFLGLLQLAVYAGAVTILLMFAVMVVKRRIFAREAVLGVRVPTLVITVLVGFVLLDVAHMLTTPAAPYPYTSPGVMCGGGDPYCVTSLGQNLFLQNGAWLDLLGLIMLSSLAGAVHLAREWRTPSVRRIRED